MRRGWLYGLVCTVLVSTQSSYARSVNAGALGDECECRSGWQRNRTYVHCPLPDRGPRDCPSDKLIDREANPNCDRSLYLPPRTINETIFRNWIWSTELECEALSWPSDESITIRIPAVGVLPCTVAERTVTYDSNCYVEAYVCSDPQKETRRLYRECFPEPDVRFGRIEGCVCPHPAGVVIIDEGIVSVYPIPVDDSIGVPGIRKISL
jgi:hypothetical protein